MSESVEAVLNRLNEYYTGRMKAARRACASHSTKAPEEASLAYQYALAATRWEAMRDAIHKVAENLNIPLKEKED